MPIVVNSARTSIQKTAAQIITRSVDAIPHSKRVRNDRILRASILSAKDSSERRQLAKVLTGSEEPLFHIDPDLGFTRFEWPESHVDLVKQSIKNARDASKADSWSGKSYFRSLKSISDYSIDSPEFRLATSPEMLKSVASYLGRLPMLLDISARISLSDPDRPGDQLSGSQLFHRDMDDIASVKVWVLCSKVATENGPTVLLPTHLSHQVAREVNYKQGDKMLDDSAFEPYQDKLFEAVGPVGTSFATDTCSSFHYGSRVRESQERLVLYFQYVSSSSVYFRPLGERAGARSSKFFTVKNPEQLDESQKILLRGYL